MKNDEAIKVFETYLTTGYVPRPYELQEASKAAIIALSSYEPLMEQPKVDLDEEIYFWIEGGGLIYPMSNKEKNNIKDTARHFYELGRKQVLQEIYDGKTKPVDKITAAWLDN